MRDFLGLCNLVFYILGALLIKQLFHSRLPTIISYPTRAHGIIVNYTTGERSMAFIY